jgi:hypothetical protein
MGQRPSAGQDVAGQYPIVTALTDRCAHGPELKDSFGLVTNALHFLKK